ncbi:MAG: hypothetical protein HYV35_12725 [Lentisphaerae bacterium]|nr:hypothetical protein [Lentisphaerota bacterium]
MTTDNLIVTTNATIYGELNIGYPYGANGAVEATGGDITMDGNYRIHTFSASGIFVVNGGASLTCDVLVVAGGGGGAAGNAGIAGGAGAGGMIYTNGVIVSGTNAVTVGQGGAGGYYAAGFAVGKNGSNSAFATLTAIGGGHGSKFGGYEEQAGNGGSGGGACLNFPTPGTGTVDQGYDGGTGRQVAPYTSGGGGGAGSVGGNATTNKSGDGGIGVACSISGEEKYYGGGGGGGVWSGYINPPLLPGTGGLGGGGNGAKNTNGTNGVPNTGGGGGSTGWADESCLGGNGGSGIVIVRYLVSSNVSPSNVPSDIVTITSDGINQTSADGTNVFMGKVGVGTDLPAEQLDVVGNARIAGTNIVGAMTLGGETRTNWPSGGGGAGDLIATNNLADLTDPAAARTNLGLGSAATNDVSAFDPAGAAAAVDATLSTHVANHNNPHQVTAVQVGALTPTGDGSQLAGLTASQVAGALIASNNLSDVADPTTARNNLGALSVNGGLVSGAIILTAPAGNIPMGIYTNR